MTDHLLEIKEGIQQTFLSTFGHNVELDKILLQETKKEFVGDYTLVVFPFTKALKSKPQDIAQKLGESIAISHHKIVKSFNVIKGFLNFEMQSSFWKKHLSEIDQNEKLGNFGKKDTKVLVEFSSPNTNKPLHLGHIRNILLGWSTSKILEAAGYAVVKTQVVNDRGIAICKSMLAWQEFGLGETPESSGIKGDHFVGRYYIKFEQKFKEEYENWQDSDSAQNIFENRENREQTKEAFFKTYKNTYFNKFSTLGGKAKKMLLLWEANDTRVKDLWSLMNSWVYQGFSETYDSLGVNFDTLYYESDTYLLGKDLIEDGLLSKNFNKKEDGSVWIDLTEEGLDHKILLRSDGTSVYMTQDLGTAEKRYKDIGAQKMIYVVADEQDYHFQVLFEIMKKLGAPYAQGMFHLSYGMVDLPSGRMKSREGKVVDADDLIQEVIDEVKKSTIERGELESLDTEGKNDIYRKIALAALKFFILKVNPQKRMIFNPEESVDIQGQTGPYIQNAYVRILSIQRKLQTEVIGDENDYAELDATEIDLIKTLMTFEDEIQKAADAYDPSTIANYAYDLAKKFHRFYHDVRILTAETEGARAFRLKLSDNVARVLSQSMNMLGIEMPERM